MDSPYWPRIHCANYARIVTCYEDITYFSCRTTEKRANILASVDLSDWLSAGTDNTVRAARNTRRDQENYIKFRKRTEATFAYSNDQNG